MEHGRQTSPESFFNGKKDRVKETQEGCLSHEVKSNFELFSKFEICDSLSKRQADGWLHGYLLSKPGAEHDYKLEWRWDRYLLRGKMFAAVTAIPEGMKDERYNGHPILNLKCDPRLAEAFRGEYPDTILPGFYMDKRTWIAVLLDGNLPEELLKDLCDLSYRLVLEKLPQYVQKELREV